MKVVGFCGASGVGKTTLIEGVIGALKSHRQRVSVIKHAHKHFDLDRPGKDSWRHGQAGAFEVLVASNRGLAKMQHFEAPVEPTVHQLIGEMGPCDWLLIEGFKHADLMKIEVWRAGLEAPAAYPDDPFVVALATDDPTALPVPTELPIFDIADAQSVARHLLRGAARFDYVPSSHG